MEKSDQNIKRSKTNNQDLLLSNLNKSQNDNYNNNKLERNNSFIGRNLQRVNSGIVRKKYANDDD